LFYGIRDYLGLGTKLALVQIIHQIVSEKDSQMWEWLLTMAVLNAYYLCATKMYSANESALLILKNKYIICSIV
jgi:hypothetical protein